MILAIHVFWEKKQTISNCVSTQGLEMTNLSSSTRIVAVYKLATYLLNSYIIQFLRHKSHDNLIYLITNTVANCLLILSMSCLRDYHYSTDNSVAVCLYHRWTPNHLHRPAEKVHYTEYYEIDCNEMNFHSKSSAFRNVEKLSVHIDLHFT